MNADYSKGRPRATAVRKYYVYNSEDQSSYCQVPGCNVIKKGSHNGNLEKHLERAHPEEYAIVCQEKAGQNNGKRQRSKSAAMDITPEQVHDICVELVTVNGRPFSFLEDSGMKKLFNLFLGATNLADICSTSSGTVRRLVTEKAREVRSSITNDLKDKFINLKVDGATRHDRAFLGINVQYIEDGAIHVRTLGVVELFAKHSADYLRETILAVLAKYDIEVANIYSFTSDNGSNMVKLGKLLLEDQQELAEDEDQTEEDEEDLDDWESEEDGAVGIDESGFCTLSDDSGPLISNIRCAVHTLQLAVDKALSTLKDSKNTLQKARSVAKALRTPTIRKQLISSKPDARKPKLDVVTRWHSTADMLESLVELKDFCRKYAKTFKALDLTDKEWQYIEEYLKSLMPARIATKRLQDEQLTLGSFYGIWLECKLETEQMQTPLATALVDAMEKREGTLFENDALLASLYLDPRFLPLLSSEQRSLAITKLESIWMALENRRKSSSSLHQSASTDRSPQGIQVDRQCDGSKKTYKSDLLRRMLTKAVAAQSVNPPVQSNIRRTLEVFGETAGFLDPDADIIQYWEGKKASMPQLYQLATIAHAAPATQVTVERLFSGMRYILSTLRANLKPQILDDIMVIRCNSQNQERVEKLMKKPRPSRQRRRTEGEYSTSSSSGANTPTDDENRSFETTILALSSPSVLPTLERVTRPLSFDQM